jgi:hypothetical protein
MSNDGLSQTKCFARTEHLRTSGKTSTTLASALQQARISNLPDRACLVFSSINSGVFRPCRGKQREGGASSRRRESYEANPRIKGGQRLEAFAEKPWGTVFVCAIVIALIVFAKPNFPIIQMPQ